MIILIASVSILIAYFTANAIFGGASMGTAKVKTIDKIDSTIDPLDTTIFNKNAINPTVPVSIQGTQATGGPVTPGSN